MQHRVLVLVASGGKQSMSALAEQLGVNAFNASRACDRLQRLGPVSTSVHHRRRSVQVKLTHDGIEVLRAVSEHRRSEVGRIKLRTVFYLSASAVMMREGRNRDFYLNKRGQGLGHVQALIALTRRRVNVLWPCSATADPSKSAHLCANRWRDGLTKSLRIHGLRR
jgi:DNA-binding MarR family transcriptional regulator